MWGLIATLLVVGFLLLAAEIFLPGMIVGTAGGLALLASVVLCFRHYGSGWGSALSLMELGGVVAFAIYWLRVMPHTRIGRRWTLHAAVAPPRATARTSPLLHQTGRAQTPLRPAGIAEFGGRRVDVLAEGEWIPAGEEVEVVSESGMRVLVRRTSVAQ